MQSGGGNGRNPATSLASPPPPPPPSTTSGVAVPASFRQSQQQHQLLQRQRQHLQQLRRAEGENAHLAYQSIPQTQRSFSHLQNGPQDIGQQSHNPAHQSHPQFAFQAAQNKPHATLIRPMQLPQTSTQNASSINQLGPAQLRAIQAWAQLNNIDLSVPASVNLIHQLVPLMKPVSASSPAGGENSAHGSSLSDRVGKSPMVTGNAGPTIQKPPTFGEQSHANNVTSGTESLQFQSLRPLQQLNRPVSHHGISSGEGAMQMPQQHIGFTKQQQDVLRAQITAFKYIKRGAHILPRDVAEAIVPPPLDLQLNQFVSPGRINEESSAPNNVKEHARHLPTIDRNPPQLSPFSEGHNLRKELVSGGEKAGQHAQGAASYTEEHLRTTSVNSEHTKAVKANEVEICNQKKAAPSSSTASSKEVPTKNFHGPLFDFPCFNKKPDHLGSTSAKFSSNLPLAYDETDLLFEEGIAVLSKKRTESMKKINGILAFNLERKRIRPDLVLRLQIEEKKLRLLDFQARLRDELDKQQEEIMAMSDRPYRKFVRDCERQRVDLSRQFQQLQKVSREKQLKSIFNWRKKLLEAHWAIRDARTTRNRGVAKYHERMLREFSKTKDDDRNKRMEALKNNGVDRYREMLLEQQISVPDAAAQRYAVLSSFLSQTEEYLLKLGGKITASKTNQEVDEAANAAARAARSQGLSEEEVKAAAACAREEVMIRNRFSEMNAPKDTSSVNKYYNLAHAVNERVLRQPSKLCAGTLRDYQLVGLQWMLSLYNNKLNGILADEMGLGKTVQVMALIAYLMEFKGNYGPHLIIVPNAVLVNWKSELHNWLPSLTCIYYVGGKEQRSKLFSREVLSMKFNVLVTTYEFVMYDRSKLSKINWKYIIIDEAQRMKDRESVLARDLDRYRCVRRLLLTGTPLQNELKELWSLLNLLLPEVFDNRKAFHDWFAQPFQKDGPSHSQEEDDWLETEKKVIIIHRLHQILEPFMLRRRVEDVEGSLPPKVSIVLRCRMSAIQGTIYDWIKSTGTIRVDPQDELHRSEKNPMYQIKKYKNLNNKCMELRKVCNHPLLNYPYFNDYSRDFLVRSCGKLWVLDRILIKLQRAGHRVLLFSTMTKLLDILEDYLQWRRLVYRRIDGTTSLEDRESAIVDFNSPDSTSFIFLLSIRAAGRGLNLQSADTVVIYDPDPNPQNEEQAVARAHRIGQTREVKVIYMEAVVDKVSSFQKEDDLRNGDTEEDLEDDFVGKDRYMGSIESLIRSNIQQYKIDMADEVINAGRFDQRTTHEERRMTLESLLHDEDRCQETAHDVPSLQEINRMIARSEEEVELFDQMDEEFDWTRDMVTHNQVPQWLRAGSREVDAIASTLSKKSAKNILATSINFHTSELPAERRRGRPKGSSTTLKHSIYVESDDDDGEDSDSSLGEENAYEDGEFNGVIDVPSNNKDHLEEEAGSIGSSESRRLPQSFMHSISSRKFGSLSALDVRPAHTQKIMPYELEEGEIAASGDSHMDLHESGSWIHDHKDGEEERGLHPKLKRKRSIRLRPKHKEQSSRERNFPFLGTNQEIETFSEPVLPRKDTSTTSLKHKPMSSGGLISANTKMSESMQRKCRNVVSRFKRTIDKDGHQIVPILFDLWKRNDNSSFSSNSAVSSNLLDLHRIEQRIDGSEYIGVMDFVADVQMMLETVVRYSSYSHEVGNEAGILQDVFFDISKTVFPETDFLGARTTFTFSGQSEGTNTRGYSPKIQMQTSPECGSILAHPGDLVICKKKRKDRDKQRVGPASPPTTGWVSPRAHGSPGVQEGQWMKPVKRTRTDIGKRRPSHL